MINNRSNRQAQYSGYTRVTRKYMKSYIAKGEVQNQVSPANAKRQSPLRKRKRSSSRSKSPHRSSKRRGVVSPRSRSKKKNRGKSSTKKRRTETEIAEHLKPNGDTRSRSRLAYRRSKRRATSRYSGSSQYYEGYKKDSIEPHRPGASSSTTRPSLTNKLDAGSSYQTTHLLESHTRAPSS